MDPDCLTGRKALQGIYLMASDSYPVAKVGCSSNVIMRYRQNALCLQKVPRDVVPAPLLVLAESFYLIGFQPLSAADSVLYEKRVISKARALFPLLMGSEWFRVPPREHALALRCFALAPVSTQVQEVFKELLPWSLLSSKGIRKHETF